MRRENCSRFCDSKISFVHARKISSARLIVAKLKIKATHARSLNLYVTRMNFFKTTGERFMTVFVLRSRIQPR
jgi:hypothetical protein